MAEPVVVTCCAAPFKDMARKTEVMASKKCRRHSKIEERRTHSIDRMVERKTSERDSVLERFDMDQNKQRLFCTPVGRTHREVRHGYTNSNGLKNRRFTMVERNTKKTQFEVERSIPEAFLLLEMERADRGVQRIQRRDVSRCKRKTRDGWPQHRTENDGREKKQSYPRGLGKSTLKHRAPNQKKERICS